MGEQERLQKGIGTLPDMLCEMNHRVHLAPPFLCSRQLWIIIQVPPLHPCQQHVQLNGIFLPQPTVGFALGRNENMAPDKCF